MDKLKNMKISDKHIIAFIFFGIFSFLLFTGTLNSGYHFIDDHSMISIRAELEEGSFMENVLLHIKDDLNIRFRPFYYFFYVSEVQIFGTDFIALSAFTGLLAFFTFSFFYVGMRKLRHSIPESFLFVLLIFVGSQAAVWWRLGTNETIAMFFLGLSFLFMVKCLEKEKYKSNNIFFIIALVITSLCKESFIVIIPAFVFFKIWNEKNVFNITVRESLKNNKLLVLPIIVMLWELWVIKFVVGTNQIGYAGMTSSMEEFAKGIGNILFNKNSLSGWIILIGMLMFGHLIPLFFLKTNNGKSSEHLKGPFGTYLIFSLLVIVPNIFMHAKSGMMERYLLPTTLGLSFLAVGILHSTKQALIKAIMIMISLVFIYFSFGVAKKNAIHFANEGRMTNALLSAVRQHSGHESKILLVADPVDRFEVSWSTKIYLQYYGLENLYAYPVVRKYKSEFELGLQKQWEQWFENRKLDDMERDPDVIIAIDKKQEEIFFIESGLSREEYAVITDDNGPYRAYLKRN